MAYMGDHDEVKYLCAGIKFEWVLYVKTGVYQARHFASRLSPSANHIGTQEVGPGQQHKPAALQENNTQQCRKLQNGHRPSTPYSP